MLVTAIGITEPEPERVAIPGDVFIALTATPPASTATFAMQGTTLHVEQASGRGEQRLGVDESFSAFLS